MTIVDGSRCPSGQPVATGGHRRRFRDFGREPPPDARHWW
ncbi:hypothetical protein MINT15_00500 [Saccharomonospora viridis]|uniref:Uncharacterized protein n=1 Tax=Saccharomonospora viridis TaxID=1852 RepID=A0A837DCW3_9PSEU|nr:hypothetical protein MINT15_00500 [Saccharomonospora viridis]